MTEDAKNDLIVAISNEKAVAIFTDEKTSRDLIDKIKEKCKEFTPDISSKKGRDEITSFAYKMTRTRTTLDELGKNLNEDKQKEINAVNSYRKWFRDQIDSMRDEIKKPLTDWQDREKKRLEAIDHIKAEVEHLSNVSFTMTSTDANNALVRVDQIRREGGFDEFEEEITAKINATILLLQSAVKEIQERERLAAELEAEREARKKETAEREAKEKADREEREAKERVEREERDAKEQIERDRLAKIEKERQAEQYRQNQEFKKMQDELEALKKKEAEKELVAGENGTGGYTSGGVGAGPTEEKKPEPKKEPIKEQVIRTTSPVVVAARSLFQQFPQISAKDCKAIAQAIFDGKIANLTSK